VTSTLAEATARLEAATAEAEAIEDYERNWSAGARKARLKRLREEQLAAADAERTELNRLAREADRLAAELEPMYLEAADVMEAFVAAVERVIEARTPYEDAWRRARAAGVDVSPLVPRAAARAASERGDSLRLVRRLQNALTRGW